jgi:DNA mismatch repair protein MutS
MAVRTRPAWHFEPASAARALIEQFSVKDLSGFGVDGKPLAIGAAGCLLQFVRDTQKSSLPHLCGLSVAERDDTLLLDAATRRNLELDTSLSGRTDSTLIGVLDRTATAMGGRELRRWLQRPLRARIPREQRLQAIESLLESGAGADLHDVLRRVGDVERILARVALRSARPRDVAQLRVALASLPDVAGAAAPAAAPLVEDLVARVSQYPELVALLTRAIVETRRRCCATAG